ncbi:hypothetical protein [Rhodococcus sp. BS-15]|uniref:hypothetical protein n=1 Tax=Rhodococcus sp. BS-15 TaxID=1304954 RepID=UPI000FFBCD96|nr:hypothetical protein [Rhodococcus sp. BS-15]
MTRTPTRAERALLFFFANSFAETLQAVGILWAAFALTDSGVVVGVVNAFAYLPVLWSVSSTAIVRTPATPIAH